MVKENARESHVSLALAANVLTLASRLVWPLVTMLFFFVFLFRLILDHCVSSCRRNARGPWLCPFLQETKRELSAKSETSNLDGTHCGTAHTFCIQVSFWNNSSAVLLFRLGPGCADLSPTNAPLVSSVSTRQSGERTT